MNWPVVPVEVPPGVVTVTFTVPGASAGAVAVTCVAELTTMWVDAVVPKCTEVAPVKLVPVMITEVPPACGPEVGLIEVTVGGAS